MLRFVALATLLIASAAAAQQAGPSEGAGDGKDKMVCKRFLETGSLVKSYRTCKPKSEWDRERENIRANSTTSGSCSSANTGNCGG